MSGRFTNWSLTEMEAVIELRGNFFRALQMGSGNSQLCELADGYYITNTGCTEMDCFVCIELPWVWWRIFFLYWQFCSGYAHLAEGVWGCVWGGGVNSKNDTLEMKYNVRQNSVNMDVLLQTSLSLKSANMAWTMTVDVLDFVICRLFKHFVICWTSCMAHNITR